jgi:hypothetical protein
MTNQEFKDALREAMDAASRLCDLVEGTEEINAENREINSDAQRLMGAFFPFEMRLQKLEATASLEASAARRAVVKYRGPLVLLDD